MRIDFPFMFALALATVAVGCTEQDASEIVDEESPALQTEGHGSGGTNGLSDDDFNPYRSQIGYWATHFTLVTPGTNVVNPSIATTASPAALLHVLKYVVACTVPDATSVYVGLGQYPGKGHLAFGAQWLTGTLTRAQAGKLVACVAAHVNPYGYTVPLKFTGADIGNDNFRTSGIYDVPEALWQGWIDLDYVPHFIVYPLPDVEAYCGYNLPTALGRRVCGRTPAECNLTIGNIEDCVPDLNGNYTCLGQPAFQTTLQDSGIPDLYAYCTVVPW